MATAKTGDTVRVHYTGKLSDGTVFDSSEGREAFEVQLGSGRVIPGFEESIQGMSIGEMKTVTLAVEKAYGERREDLMVTVSRTDVPTDVELELGLALQLHQSDGDTLLVRVAELRESEVVLDANHPLAGKELTFDLELVEIVGETT